MIDSNFFNVNSCKIKISFVSSLEVWQSDGCLGGLDNVEYGTLNHIAIINWIFLNKKTKIESGHKVEISNFLFANNYNDFQLMK